MATHHVVHLSYVHINQNVLFIHTLYCMSIFCVHINFPLNKILFIIKPKLHTFGSSVSTYYSLPIVFFPTRSRKSIPDSYVDQLVSEGLMTEEERGQIKTTCYAMLNDRLNNMTVYSPPPTNLQGRWGDLVEPQNRISLWDTGVTLPLLQFVGAKSVNIPEEIHLHSHLMKTHVQVKRNWLM